METSWGLEARIETGQWEHIGMYASREAAIHAALQEHPFATQNEDGCSVFGLTRDTVNGRQMCEMFTVAPEADGLKVVETYP
jgi:hypothetical protein